MSLRPLDWNSRPLHNESPPTTTGLVIAPTLCCSSFRNFELLVLPLQSDGLLNICAVIADYSVDYGMVYICC